MDSFGITPTEALVELEQDPLVFESRDGNYKGSLYGLHEKHRLFGMFPDRLTDPKIKNLYYCGSSVQPGAGLPMVTLSGRFVAELVGQ
jgi:phytoene dehydrogenase-like protein